MISRVGRAASLCLFCQESTAGMRLRCLLPCLVGIRGRVRCAGRCRANRRCQCFSPRSPSGTGLMLGHALGDEPASVPVNRSPPKRVGGSSPEDAVQSRPSWLLRVSAWYLPAWVSKGACWYLYLLSASVWFAFI